MSAEYVLKLADAKPDEMPKLQDGWRERLAKFASDYPTAEDTPDALMQLVGMRGLIQNVRRTFGWAMRLRSGKVTRRTTIPASPIPMRNVDGAPADHALPGTPIAAGRQLVQLGIQVTKP